MRYTEQSVSEGEISSGPVVPLIIVTKANLDRNIFFFIRSRTQTQSPQKPTTVAVIFPSTDYTRARKQLMDACDPFLIVLRNHHTEIPATGWFIGVICFD